MTSSFLRPNPRALGIRVLPFTIDALRPRPCYGSLDISACWSLSTFTATGHVFRSKSLPLKPPLSRGRGWLSALKHAPNWGLQYRAEQSTWSYHAERQPCDLTRKERTSEYPEKGHGTPLTTAARKGNVDLVEMLLDNGADVTLASKSPCVFWLSKTPSKKNAKILSAPPSPPIPQPPPYNASSSCSLKKGS